MSNIVNDSNELRRNLSSQVDSAHYQTALKLSERAYQAFKTLSQQPMSSGDDSAVLTKLEDSLADLATTVRDNASGQVLMAVAHHDIHPNLQAAYDLKLKR